MKLKDILHSLINHLYKAILFTVNISIIFSTTFLFSHELFANEETQGEYLFMQNCSGCHINGGNIIRRNKTLKLKDLKRNGLDDPKAIARVARFGIGSMSGYEEKLGEGGDQLVANWIWNQSQKAWIHG